MLIAFTVSHASTATPISFKYVNVSSRRGAIARPVPTMSKSGVGSTISSAAKVSGVMSRARVGDHAAWSASYAKMLPTQYAPFIANPRAS